LALILLQIFTHANGRQPRSISRHVSSSRYRPLSAREGLTDTSRRASDPPLGPRDIGNSPSLPSASPRAGTFPATWRLARSFDRIEIKCRHCEAAAGRRRNPEFRAPAAAWLCLRNDGSTHRNWL